MKKLSAAVLAALVALALTSCELVTATTGSNNDQPASTPSVHGNVVLNVIGGSLPSGAQVRVAITNNSGPKSLVTPRVAAPVPTGDFHKDIPVSGAGTVSYQVTGVPDGSYGIVVTLMDASQYVIGSNPGGQSITVTGGACAVPEFSINYTVLSIE